MMKIVMLCSFSNALVRERQDVRISKVIQWLYKKATGHIPFTTSDYGVWNTNAIKEFEKIDEVELHVISPCPFLKDTIQEFDVNGIHYHFFFDESSSLIRMVYKKVLRPTSIEYKRNRRIVKKLIDKIKPDVVHLIGAENPQYALALLDVPSNIPTIAQLQTLLNDPDFKTNFPIDETSYRFFSSVECKILHRADYIGTRAAKFIDIIKNRIKPDATFINTTLAVGEDKKPTSQIKLFDFVYFAADISKSCDIALEAFGLAYKQNTSITLDIVGGYTDGYKSQLDEIIDRHGIAEAVSFEGRLATHDDVINQIRKAKFALLPLKIDLISGTIREAMSNGLPVITTDTGDLGTQQLNKYYQCALISPKTDYQSIADDMIRIHNDENLAESLRQNGYRWQYETYNNEVTIHEYVEAYKTIISNNLNNKKRCLSR